MLALFDDFQRQTTKQLSEEGPEARKKVVKTKEEKKRGLPTSAQPDRSTTHTGAQVAARQATGVVTL